MVNRLKLLAIARDVWLTGRGELSDIVAAQQMQLAGLIEFAREQSPFYRRLYRQLPTDFVNLASLPPVTKAELMADFDEWVTDRAVTKASVEAFVADTSLVGQPYLDRYAVWHSSGVTGGRGVFVQDSDAVALYAVLMGVRGMLNWMLPENRQGVRQRGGQRVADVIATGGHDAEFTLRELGRRLMPQQNRDNRTFSVLAPLPELVSALNDFQPTTMIGYPTVMELLVHEQVAGRLSIDPALVVTGAEGLTPTARDQIAAAFHCQVRDSYAASEFMAIAFDCGSGWLHVNADWVILEPVDEQYQPVPPGQASHTVLLTNLINQVQPIIRYDLGDSITVKPDPCPCGNPLPAIQVEGRTAELLTFQPPGGEAVRISPLALGTVVDGLPGVLCYQMIQTAPARLTVRLEVETGADRARVWDAFACRLRGYLAEQGLSAVEAELASELPRRDPATGKFRKVWSDLKVPRS